MRIEKLKRMPYAQARILYYNNEIILESYETKVLIYNPVDGVITCTGLYSMTTRKHISSFMNQFFNGKYNYHDIKYIYNNNLSLLIL